jgi:hypothetical protein
VDCTSSLSTCLFLLGYDQVVYTGVDDLLEEVPYPRERGPTTKYLSTPHFGLNFLLRSNIYSNMHPCVAALEKKRSFNRWCMTTELQVIEVKSVSNLPNSRKFKPYAAFQRVSCFLRAEHSASDVNKHTIRYNYILPHACMCSKG